VEITDSMGRERSDSSVRPVPKSGSSRRLRNSVDLVLNLRRGLSIDSRHSSSHRQTSSEGFGSTGFSDKRRLHDEERGFPVTHFASLRRHISNSSSHGPSSFATTTPRSPPIPAGYKPRSLNDKQYSFAVPMQTPRGAIIRKWQLHPSRNRFFAKGHILTGGDTPWAFIVCFSVLCAISGVWFATTCQWWWHQEGAGGKVMVCIGGYLTLIVFSSMLKTVINFICH